MMMIDHYYYSSIIIIVIIYCVNNKMLKYDWLLTVSHNLRINWLFQVQTVRFDLSNYKH